MLPPASFYDHVILASKVIGAAGVIVGLFYGGIRWLTRVAVKITSINTNVELITTKHLPEMQTDVACMRKDFEGIKTEVAAFGATTTGNAERLEDTKRSLDAFGAAFLQHLENAGDARRHATEVVAAAAIEAAKTVRTAAHTAQDVIQTAEVSVIRMPRKKKQHASMIS